MKTRFFYFTTFILFVCVLASCSKPDQPDEARALYTESMKIHDEVMPLMDEMYTLENKLKALRNSLLSDSTHNAEKIIMIDERLLSLEASGKSMMDWMHNIKDVPGLKTAIGHEHHTEHQNHGEVQEVKPEEILKVQQDQKSRIELVKAAMEKSIEEAKKILQPG